MNWTTRACLPWLATLTLSSHALAADLVPTESRRQAFGRALARQDEDYDPAEKMLAARFSSPGYHTTLKGGTVHATCGSKNLWKSAGKPADK